jgi:hypothetical protein
VLVSRRAVLWVAFLIVHVGVAVLGFVLPTEPMGDVYKVYEPWSTAALTGHGIVGITLPWVYPQLALVPMILAHGFVWITQSYTPAWALLVIAADALAFWMLVGRGRSVSRNVAAWFWLSFIALLGPVGIYRLDGFTVPLALAGCLWLVGRPWIGSILLSIATWMKVWPAALLAAAIVAVRRRMAILGGIVVVSALTLLGIVFAGGGPYAFSFIGDQTGRGLQVEAPVATVYLWQAVARVPGSEIYYDRGLNTFGVHGPGEAGLIALMTPLLAIAVLAILVIGAVKAWNRGSFHALFPPLALSLVLAFIVFNKVGSPQYVTWIAAPLVVGLVIDRRRWLWPATLALVLAFVTLLEYPIWYQELLMSEAFPAVLLTLRSALTVALLVWAIVRLVRVPVLGHSRAPRAVAAR